MFTVLCSCGHPVLSIGAPGWVWLLLCDSFWEQPRKPRAWQFYLCLDNGSVCWANIHRRLAARNYCLAAELDRIGRLPQTATTMNGSVYEFRFGTIHSRNARTLTIYTKGFCESLIPFLYFWQDLHHHSELPLCGGLCLGPLLPFEGARGSDSNNLSSHLCG